jgi:hypothetical protein
MTSRRWEVALADHQEALDRCIAAARRVPDDKWNIPRSDGKWSPAQQLIHVGLAYQMVLDDLNGNPPRPRVSKRWQFLLRTFFLPFVIRYDYFSDGVPAPREVRPPADVTDRDAIEVQVRERAGLCVDAMLAAPNKRVSHPYFGSIALLKMLKVGTSHTRHHTRIIQAGSSPD